VKLLNMSIVFSVLVACDFEGNEQVIGDILKGHPGFARSDCELG